MARFPFTPYPDGWFVACESSALPPRQVLPLRLCARALVLFRTAAGPVAAADAACPHLGADLGRGGEVDREYLVCPFHRFAFDADGHCWRVPCSDGRPPGKARLGLWPVREMAGLILVHHAAGGGNPVWEVPDLPMDGWTPLSSGAGISNPTRRRSRRTAWTPGIWRCSTATTGCGSRARCARRAPT